MYSPVFKLKLTPIQKKILVIFIILLAPVWFIPAIASIIVWAVYTTAREFVDDLFGTKYKK